MLHCELHAPQLLTSFKVFTSQPSVTLLLQSRQVLLQLPTPHAPELQTGTPLFTTQPLPQPPQFAGSVSRLRSQPSPAKVLQSAKPAAQVPTPHVPPLQTGVPFETVQFAPHAPQLVRLVAVFTSQPLPGRPSQLLKPALHEATVQVPLTHAGEPFAAAHVTLHAPQLFKSL